MTIDRRRFLGLTGSAVAAPAILHASRAGAQEVSLRLHHVLPPVSNGHANFLKPWADRIATESNGRIRIDIFPSMQLGGTPPQLFDQARDGVVDMVWTLPGYTPGRFTGIEAFELPFFADRRALVNSLALADYAQAHLADEFKDVQPLCLWTHDAGVIHANRLVRTAADLKGLKLRFPTRLAGEALRALGANAIGMPVPQVPESLAQRVLDGCVIPWEVVPSVKVQELVRFHSEVAGSPTFYVATFVLVMNKAKYAGMSADLRAIIDRNSGAAAAAIAGAVWDRQAGIVAEMVRKRGNTITVIDAEEAGRWRRTTAPVWDGWLKTAKEKGLDGGKMLETAKAALARHQNAA